MDSLNSNLVKVMSSKHSLSVANQQFDLLTRLLRSDSSLVENNLSKFPEIVGDLEDVYLLTHKVSEKVELVYQYLSVCYQLPNDAFSEEPPT